MSRLNSPFTSQDQGCFCCPPPMTSTASCPGQMRGNVFSTAGNTTRVKQDLSGHKSNSIVPNEQLTDPNSLNTLLQNIHLHGQGEFDRKESTSVSFQLPRDEASPIESTDYNPSSIFQSESVDVKMNFRALQARQLGKFNSQRSYLSTSAPSVGSRMNNENPQSIMSDMDLDQALDELGMLSTVTQSRRHYLLESRGSASAMKREKRLRSKSESSPNLSSLTRLNGYRVVQFDPSYVTSVFSNSSPTLGLSGQSLFPLCDFNTPPVKSQQIRMEYRNPDVLESSSLARRRRSVPRMSRLRTARYWRSRCPYKVPNRLCHSMQEGDFDLEGFQNCHELFGSSTTSLPDASREQAIAPDVNKAEACATTTVRSQQQSKSNTNSPIKPCQDQPLARSHSVEDLHSVPLRKLALLFDVQAQSKKEEEAHLEQIASQFTDLHMS